MTNQPSLGRVRHASPTGTTKAQPLSAWRPVPWRMEIVDIHNITILDADDGVVIRLHAAHGVRAQQDDILNTAQQIVACVNRASR